MRRLLSPRHFTAAVMMKAAGGDGDMEMAQNRPRRIHLWPPWAWGPGTRVLGTRARARTRASALVLNAYLLSFAFVSRNNMHATPSIRTADYTYRNGRRLSQRKKAICRFEYHVDKFPGRAIEERMKRETEKEMGELRARKEKRGRKKTEMENRKWHFPDRM